MKQFLTILALLATSTFAIAKDISSVDTSLDGSQKYVLKVDGKPFYMTNIQIRMEKLRDNYGWGRKEREAIVARAAADGFNTVSIPIHWFEIEPSKDHFDWSILDEYLETVTRCGIKMELLWFGQNGVGGTAWLGPTGRQHLRVPDYVLYSPGPGSKATTSDYTIAREVADYTLDLRDEKLMGRERFVLSKVMEHIASWDASHGSPHTVIGVQIDNEVFGARVSFPNSTVIKYLSHVAGAVKESDYVVWTRINCVYWEAEGRIAENERQRLTESTNIDFVGLDTYKHHPQFTSYDKFVDSMRSDIPYCGSNYRMFMEIGSEVSSIAQLQLAALSGNCAFDYYDMCGTDGHGLYVRDGDKGFKPNGAYIEDVRLTNKILRSSNRDIATLANGYGLFVHNWRGLSPLASVSNAGIGFVPGRSGSQGISIVRSKGEIVLQSSLGGIFTLPKSIGARRASSGEFDAKDNWNENGSVLSITSGKTGDIVEISAGATVLVECEDSGYEGYIGAMQAERALVGGSATIESGNGLSGFAGNGYVRLPRKGAGYVAWEGVGNGNGGAKTMHIRYALGRTEPAVISLFVNGAGRQITLPSTGSDEIYRTISIGIDLERGTGNRIELASVAGDVVGISGLDFNSGGLIDEIRID